VIARHTDDNLSRKRFLMTGTNGEKSEIDLQLNKPHTKANSAKAGDAKPGI